MLLDLWAFNVGANSWINVGQSPTVGYAMTLISTQWFLPDGPLIMYGGYAQGSVSSGIVLLCTPAAMVATQVL